MEEKKVVSVCGLIKEDHMKMKLRNIICCLGLMVFSVILSGCVGRGQTPGGLSSITLMTWNVHNLFDGDDEGNLYAEFKQSAGWSQEKYLGRINTISDAIGGIEPLPDIIILQEIESLQTLEDIALALKRDFSYCQFASNPGGIGLGIISRFPLSDVKTHSITTGGITTPRPVLEARAQTQHGDFIIMACHWKSKVGGEEATEFNRRASAMAIVRRVQEIWKSEPELGVIIASDLNENHDEFSRRGSDVICALLPDAPLSARLANSVQKDFIVISGNKPPLPEYFPDETVVFYSPWVNELENGSYLYKNNCETIDHILVSGHFFDNSGLEYEKTTVLNYDPFTDPDGNPVSYNARTGYGLSDHLPLLVTLFFDSGGLGVKRVEDGL